MTHGRRDIYLEFIPQGKFVKVSAICALTGTEVSIVGDPNATKAELERVAVSKLKYVLEKNQGKNKGKKAGFIV